MLILVGEIFKNRSGVCTNPLATGHLVSVRHVLEHAGGKIAATGILAALGTLIGP